MRLCVLGGHGKTGSRVVQVARTLGHDVKVLEGDALDPAALSLAIHGAEAVISVIGPVKTSVEHFCSRATAQIIDVMREQGVQRLVMVTGAMCGPEEELGIFYTRRCARSRSWSRTARVPARGGSGRTTPASGSVRAFKSLLLFTGWWQRRCGRRRAS